MEQEVSERANEQLRLAAFGCTRLRFEPGERSASLVDGTDPSQEVCSVQIRLLASLVTARVVAEVARLLHAVKQHTRLAATASVHR